MIFQIFCCLLILVHGIFQFFQTGGLLFQDMHFYKNFMSFYQNLSHQLRMKSQKQHKCHTEYIQPQSQPHHRHHILHISICDPRLKEQFK